MFYFLQISCGPRADENDNLLIFSFASKSITVKPLTLVPAIKVYLPSFVSLTVGLEPLPFTGFQLYSSISDFNCSRMVFNFFASLECHFLNGTFRDDVAFFLRGNISQQAAQIKFIGRTRASCHFNVQGWTLINAGSCQIRVSIPDLAISELTPSFLVEAGPAVSGQLLGFLPSRINGGSIIWTSNSSGIPCIAVQLSDAFNNLVTNSAESYLLSAFLLGTVMPYTLLGEVNVQTDGNGVARWCNLRMSVVLSKPICLRVSGVSMNWIFPSCVNVSQPGVATALSVRNASDVLNSTILSGAGIPQIRLVLSDSAGNVAYGNGQVVAIRLRVIRTVRNSNSSSYVHVFPIFYSIWVVDR